MSLTHLFYFLSALALCMYASAASDDASEFTLFAYGSSIGGLPIFYADGNAQLGNAALSNASSISYVQFTQNSSSPTELLANPNATANSNIANSDANWSNKELFVPTSDSSNQQVGFASSPNSQQQADSFVFYGGNVMVNTGSGGLVSTFYAQPSGIDGVWLLLWNLTETQQSASSAVAVALRTFAPSTYQKH